ncbi:EpsG family protein [Sphingomonas abietis]|uniref:EpsG family protein n=1 Tax=Sphingomonas abietis TaxID=3012344 RepID=A0ABY7NHM3_9SPHN|nr:EpsG family protein [Sphingomonas abietis]WBO20823.1 EpsG family protein [Sphingomonas abietis]
MLIYWAFMGFACFMAMIEQGVERVSHRVNFIWVMFTIALALFIGGRWKTGGDWGNYYVNLEPFYQMRLGEAAASSKDVGFTLLEIIAAEFTTGIVVITMFSGIVMAVALLIFCLRQPRPWLCMAVAFPYLVVVCGMGYIRQGIAISFIMVGLTALDRDRIERYIGWVMAGAMFHATALAMIPLGAVVSKKNRLLVIAMVGAITLLAYHYLIASRADNLVTNYVDVEAESSGALVRSLMGALPGAIFLVFRKNFGLSGSALLAWMALSAAAIATVPAVLLYPSSTVVDRLGLYLLPVQCFVYARAPDALARNAQQRLFFAIGTLLLYIVVFFTFINYSDHAKSWVPYRFYLFEDGICLECGGPDRSY